MAIKPGDFHPTENPVAHVQSAASAWQYQQREIDTLHAQIMEMREQVEHLRQRAHEAEARLPRLRLVG